eukprot:TRINITY_DN8562_c0_g1_i1.p1 TRINITY_DN8562_c0_g1~~TRINITY_DN8562_c0_g1_i1.p1  ORF type:complete len:499 (-),score=75.13 TRINITY_DN8562_c0_g1_i1:3-1499(-)
MENRYGEWPIQLNQNELKGRHFVASRDVKKGEVVIRSAPFSSAINDSELFSHCSSCFIFLSSTSKSKQICSGCKAIVFCTRCYKNAQSKHSSSGECEFLRKKDSIRFETKYLRCLLQFCYSINNTKNQNQHSFAHGNDSKPNLKDGIVFDSLEDCMSLKDDTTENEHMQSILNIVRQLTSIKSHNMDIKVLKKALGIIMQNGHEITLTKNIGIGLHPSGAIFNHSCAPNVLFFHDNLGNLCFRADQDVKQGTELSTHYIHLYQPTDTRREQLLSSYSFHCNCERCCNSLKFEEITAFVCKNKNCGKILKLKDDQLYCERCDCKHVLKEYQNSLEKSIEFQQKAIMLSNTENYDQVFGLAIKALSFGNVLHPYHHINFKNYECMHVSCSEMQKYDLAIKYVEKMLECLDVFTKKENVNVLPSIASLNRLLALYYQDWANETASKGKDATALIDKSYTQFCETKKLYEGILGRDHWYCLILQQVIDMFDGKNDGGIVEFL